MIDKEYLYEAEVDDFLLTEHEEKVMRAMRGLNKLWNQKQNRLILFCGMDCTIRINKPSYDHEIESFDRITCDGGDGSDKF